MSELRASSEKSPFTLVPEDSPTLGTSQEEIEHLRGIIRMLLAALGDRGSFRDNLPVVQQRTFDFIMGKINH